ncbi:hypothetical protein BZB76_1289 [Actinomadura pelletieri DSM 43383]|uniref:Leucine rich repeat (LRR) protein n=1 Tax=Actinomadura pelletieri DSM 43383 TaxID=1120940 RepID=A0A495R069_9ACTN|nr:hypothetical protein [Actinomadura pelletieri]RKS79810.1 hypothetical protein BZB76_1289 [Actinomadura pelletieri DSM 43383]
MNLDWEEFWAGLWPVWRRVLAGTESPTPPPAGPILRRRRLTTDFAWVGTFEPVRYLPAVTEALLWDDNGMDLGPLTGRHWELLHLGGPAVIDIGELSGTPVDHLALTVVDVRDIVRLREIPGLRSLTLAHGDFGELPALDRLMELTIYAEVTVDTARNPGLRVVRRDEMYFPPFGPDDVDV